MQSWRRLWFSRERGAPEPAEAPDGLDRQVNALEADDKYSAFVLANETVVAGCFSGDTTSGDCSANEGSTSAWVLLDSRSTVDLITDKTLLRDLHTAECPIRVHGTTGSVVLSEKGYLGSYPVAVWYNPHEPTNIMSMFRVSHHYRVTMDTDLYNGIDLHTSDHNKISFTPSPKGLYRHVLPNV